MKSYRLKEMNDIDKFDPKDVSNRYKSSLKKDIGSTEIMSDYQAGVASCFDGCSKMFIPILDNGVLEAAMKQYRRLKGPIGGGLLGDMTDGVDGYLSNLKYLGYDDDFPDEDDEPTRKSSEIPKLHAIVTKLENALQINEKMIKRSPEFEKGFMDCFTWLDSNLDSLMDDGSLEAAFKKYKEIRGNAYLEYSLRGVVAFLTGQEFNEEFDFGKFQDLIDIMEGKKTRFEESTLNRDKFMNKLNETTIFDSILSR